jgi:molybdate transport system ATP-binding protein
VLDTKVLRHDEAFGMSVLGSAAGEIRVPPLAIVVGAPVRIRIRARDVMIATEQPKGLSALNILPGTIVAISPGEGPTVEVGIDCNGATVLARITEQSRQALGLELGSKVFAVVKTVSFDRANTAAGLPIEADG